MEVLVAIFIMAIGLLALLALFPLGALTMAQAIKDSRSAQSVQVASSISESQQIRNDPNIFIFSGNSLDPFTNGNTPPGGGNIIWTGTWVALNNLPNNGTYSGPSYPVFVDGLVGINLNLNQNTLGDNQTLNSPGIPRRSVSFVNSTKDYDTWFTLLDDISFNPDGTPVTPGGGTTIERDSRYSWAYMLRRPNFLDTKVVDLTAVIYRNRSRFVAGETTYQYQADLSNGPTNLMTITWGPTQEKPAIRPGGWVLDSTVIQIGTQIPEPQGTFYRVTSVTDLGNNQVAVELQTNLRRKVPPPNPPPSPVQGVVTVMDNVVEVFEKGPGRFQ
jgi:hypothetical protein